MFLSAELGVAKHREDDLVVQRLAGVRLPESGPTKRIGLLNERRQVYRIVVCGVGREFDVASGALEDLGFTRALEHEQVLRIETVYGKP